MRVDGVRRRILGSTRTTLHQEVRTMARDSGPVTEKEFAAFEEAMEEQIMELREALAEDPGGDPEDYEPGSDVSSSYDWVL